jgi:hypothetical protein
MPSAQVTDAFEKEFTAADKPDHELELVTKITPGQPVSFWAGSGWDKAGEFTNYDAWNKHVDEWSQRINSPLKVTVGH